MRRCFFFFLSFVVVYFVLGGGGVVFHSRFHQASPSFPTAVPELIHFPLSLVIFFSIFPKFLQ